MSATAAGDAGLAGARQAPRENHSRGRVFRLLIVGADIALLGLALAKGSAHIGRVSDLVIWALLIAVAGSITVQKDGYHLGFDLPVLLGAGLVFGPLVAGILGLVAVFDVREFRREVPFELALFNRAEISISAMAGAAAFQATSVPLGDWPWTAVAGLLALTVDVVVNYCLVAGYSAYASDIPLRQVIAQMRFGPASSFIPIYACFGFLGVLIAEGYMRMGVIGVVAFVAPVAVARQAFSHRQALDTANESLGITRRALDEAERRMAKERKDERLTLAGELHDEVLPPLFQVHLMAQVLRQDLKSGRLLDLDEDLPALLEATELAQSATRALVRNLRKSALGAQGLLATLRSVAQQLESLGSPRIVLDLREVAASPDHQLLVYQVAREAMRNAARYSKAKLISVSLSSSAERVRVSVHDDGVGFDPRAVDLDEHFGLQLISERIAAVGGSVDVDSRLGQGTTVVALLPSR